MRTRSLALTLALVGGCIDCYGPGSHTTPTRGRLTVVTVPEDAIVRIDDETVVSGRAAAAQPLELRVGHHLVTVEATGYFPHDLEVDVTEGETRVRVALRPLPP